MKKIIYCLFLLFIFACKTKNQEDKKNINRCAYLIDSLLKKDSDRFIIRKEKNSTEILDTLKDSGGSYKFDDNHILRKYCFLYNTEKDSFRFEINYDANGNQISEPDSYVVRWLYERKGNDSLFLTFYLFAVNYSYGNIKLYNRDFSMPIRLYQTKFYSNLVRGYATIFYPAKKTTFYVAGIVRNDCSLQRKDFTDSASFN